MLVVAGVDGRIEAVGQGFVAELRSREPSVLLPGLVGVAVESGVPLEGSCQSERRRRMERPHRDLGGSDRCRVETDADLRAAAVLNNQFLATWHVGVPWAMRNGDAASLEKKAICVAAQMRRTPEPTFMDAWRSGAADSPSQIRVWPSMTPPIDFVSCNWRGFPFAPVEGSGNLLHGSRLALLVEAAERTGPFLRYETHGAATESAIVGLACDRSILAITRLRPCSHPSRSRKAKKALAAFLASRKNRKT